MASISNLVGQNSSVAVPQANLYVDCIRNADDTRTSVRHLSGLRWAREGQFFPGWVPDDGLREQLLELQRRYGPGFLPDRAPDVDILLYFQELFFPDSFTGSFLFSNISLEDGFPLLCVRPGILGPRLQQALPRGITLAICGHLYNYYNNPENPVLLVQRIVDMSDSPPRSFERERCVLTFAHNEQVYPDTRRQRNLLSAAFINSLPPISVQTRERLKDWRAYLDWKERLTQANLVGLRYVQVKILSDGQIRFLTIAESQESFDRCRRVFGKDDLRAFEVGYSMNPWNFEYNENHGRREISLGDFVACKPLGTLPKVDLEGMPWQNPVVAHVCFRMNEDDQNEFDSMTQSGTPDEVISVFEERIHPAGFLALSVVGDLSLVRRQRRELEQLQQQSGYAPYLSSYLFDIKAANTPAGLVEIADGQWFRSDLNDDQKLAVRKMVSTPDLAMVQGPPGTGKTTMIAEAAWHLTRQGKKVLLASQANLAVDNALERLAQAPSIRAIRLGKRGDKDYPFSQDRALRTYYATIAQACRQRTLDTWQQADALQKELSRWLAAADLLVHDIAELREDERGLEAERNRLDTELSAERDTLSRAEQESARRLDAQHFVPLLDNDAEWSGALPEKALRIFFDQIALPMNVLQHVGIRANPFWPVFEQGDCRQRSAFAAEILRARRQLMAALPQFDGDLRRLEAQDGELVLSSQDALLLTELHRKRQVVLSEMELDEKKVTEYQALQNQIREVKRKGGGLERSLYEQIFDGGGERRAFLRFIDPNANRADVVLGLRQAIEAIHSVQSTVDAGIKQVRDALVEFLESPPIITANARKINLLEGQHRDVTVRLGEKSRQRQDKDSRFLKLMEERPRIDGMPDNQFFNNYGRMRELIVQRQVANDREIEQNRGIREAWEPVLQEWVNDLSSPTTLANDQQNFLPIYVSACNVVGVTCTENRRTLDEAGHPRFNVVIVDEVSKATPPELIMPLMLGRTAILVGDHRQLPPLFKEHEGSWEEIVAEREENAAAATRENGADSASELTAENFERFRRMVTSSLFKEHFENAPNR